MHLGKAGCTVYEYRPAACRAYDCRAYSLVGVRDTYTSGHHAPIWDFSIKSRQDRVLLLALRIAGVASFGPGGVPDKTETLKAALVGYQQHIAKASEFVDKIDRLSPEELRREVETAQSLLL